MIFSILPLPRFSKYNKWFYRWYLLSPRWKLKRKQRYNLDDGICQYCFKPVAINEFECHHVSYKRTGNESMKDLRTMHKQCHRKIHGKRHEQITN